MRIQNWQCGFSHRSPDLKVVTRAQVSQECPFLQTSSTFLRPSHLHQESQSKHWGASEGGHQGP